MQGIGLFCSGGGGKTSSRYVLLGPAKALMKAILQLESWAGLGWVGFALGNCPAKHLLKRRQRHV